VLNNVPGPVFLTLTLECLLVATLSSAVLYNTLAHCSDSKLQRKCSVVVPGAVFTAPYFLLKLMNGSSKLECMYLQAFTT
jgi:hypothetical protein